MDAQLTWEDITPEIAQQYLTLNIDNNRNPLADRIDRIARDMVNGDWIVTADPIKFNEDGKLIDGQHRLRAILRSKTTVRMLVARNVPEDAVLVIDTGATRTVAQTLKIHNSGVKNRSTVVAIAQIVNAYDRGVFYNATMAFNGRDRMSPMETVRFVEENEQVLEFAASMAASVGNHLPVTQSMLGAVFVILSRVDYEAAIQFMTALREGNSGRGADDPVATLVRRLYADKLASRKQPHGLLLFMFIRTWNAWRSHERLSKLQTGASGGTPASMPMPR